MWRRFVIFNCECTSAYSLYPRQAQRAFMAYDLKNDDDQADDGGREQRDYQEMEVKTAVGAASSSSPVKKLR